MRHDIPASPVTLQEYGHMDMVEKRRVWLQISDISEAEFEEQLLKSRARESNVPKIGDMAPDFNADILGPDRQLTGETVTLSQLRGSPVALNFGSYT
jgi:hypothetical protein